jgi:hypothetical protein
MLGLEERNSKVYLFYFFLLQQIGQDYYFDRSQIFLVQIIQPKKNFIM